MVASDHSSGLIWGEYAAAEVGDAALRCTLDHAAFGCHVACSSVTEDGALTGVLESFVGPLGFRVTEVALVCLLFHLSPSPVRIIIEFYSELWCTFDVHDVILAWFSLKFFFHCASLSICDLEPLHVISNFVDSSFVRGVIKPLRLNKLLMFHFRKIFILI